MNSTLGRRRLPCGCQHTRLPDTPGTYSRRCRICRTWHTLTVTESPTLTTKCGGGKPVLVARWETR